MIDETYLINKSYFGSCPTSRKEQDPCLLFLFKLKLNCVRKDTCVCTMAGVVGYYCVKFIKMSWGWMRNGMFVATGTLGTTQYSNSFFLKVLL